MADKKKKLKKNKDKLFNIEIEEGPRGNPAVVETYEDARENAMINRDVPTMKNGGEISVGKGSDYIKDLI